MSRASAPGIRLGTVHAAYVPYSSNADDQDFGQPVATSGIVELPVYGKNPGDAGGLKVTVDYDQIFFNFAGFRGVNDAWHRAQVSLSSDNGGTHVTVTFERYSGPGGEPGSDEFLIGFIQYGLVLDPPGTSRLEAPVRLASGNEWAGSYFYTTEPDGREQRLDTELADGSIVIYFTDDAELGSGLVSPVAQDVTLPLYLTTIRPSSVPVIATVGYDRNFLRFKDARLIEPACFHGDILAEERSDGEGETGTVTLTMVLNVGGAQGAAPLLRKHVADVVFTYNGDVPVGGSLNFSADLLASSRAPKAKDESGATKQLVARVRVGSPYFVRGNVGSRYEQVAGGKPRYGGVLFTDVVLILQHLTDGQYLPCEAAADANASRRVDMTDAIVLLRYLFSSGLPPLAPFPDAGWLQDHDTELDCDVSLPYYSVVK